MRDLRFCEKVGRIYNDIFSDICCDFFFFLISFYRVFLVKQIFNFLKLQILLE